MRLNGIIDRIDICQDASNVYVKVLDYKSSRKDLDAAHVTAGLQLQLLIYTNVVVEVLQRQFPDKKIIPAGSLYYGFKVPMVERRAKEETTKKNIEKVTAMTGLVNEEEPCISYMGSEELLPVHGDGTEDASETEQYMELLSQVQGTVKELGEAMIDGKIPIRPVKTGRSMPCDFCDYQDVCKLDCKDGGNHVMTAEQLLAVRRKEEL
jgi:ATP-dependent helicase/nuclease subunit B